MSRPAALLVAAAIATPCFVLAQARQAQPTDLRLSVHRGGISQCPDERQFRARVARRLHSTAPIDPATPRMRVDFRRRGHGIVAHLSLRRPGAPANVSPLFDPNGNCDSLTESLSLRVALILLDFAHANAADGGAAPPPPAVADAGTPGAAADTATATATADGATADGATADAATIDATVEEGDTPGATAPAPTDAGADRSPADAGVDRSPTAAVVQVEAPAPAAAASAGRWTVGAALAGEINWLPHPDGTSLLASMTLHGGRRWRRTSVFAEVGMSTPATVTYLGGSVTSLVPRAAVGGCVHLLGARSFDLCGVGRLLMVYVTGTGYLTPNSGLAPGASVGLRLGGTFPLTRSLALTAAAEANLLLLRHGITVTREQTDGGRVVQTTDEPPELAPRVSAAFSFGFVGSIP